MGRALFSQKYLSEPAVCQERDPAVPPLDVPCERWSPYNQFDPDSEEFFKDAQLEQFIGGIVASSGWTMEGTDADEAHHGVVLQNASDNASSPSTTTSNDNDESLSDSNDNPMAIGTDDPATLYTPADLQHFIQVDGLRRQGRSIRSMHLNPRHLGSARHLGDSVNFHRTPPASYFIPSVPYRASSILTASPTAQTRQGAQQAAGTSRSPVIRHMVHIPSRPSLSSPASPSPPATPALDVTYLDDTNTLTTPSPIQNTTPRTYTWNHFPQASTSSTRDSPLTNPGARLSLSRIDTMSLTPRQYNASVHVPNHPF